MSGCTAPVQGHRSAAAAAACPVHGRGYGYGGYSGRSYYSPPSATLPRSTGGIASSVRSAAGTRGTARPSWSPSTSPVSYTPEEVRNLELVRKAAEVRTQSHDVFLCHAWPDRQADAKELYDLLVGGDVSVWFSEVGLTLGTDMRAAIDRGLVSSRIGIVLVTPAMLDRLRTDRSVAGSELSALLRRNLLVPVLHNVTFEELDRVSPLLASRGGLSTAEDSMTDIAVKIGELIATLDDQEVDELTMKSN